MFKYNQHTCKGHKNPAMKAGLIHLLLYRLNACQYLLYVWVKSSEYRSASVRVIGRCLHHGKTCRIESHSILGDGTTPGECSRIIWLDSSPGMILVITACCPAPPAAWLSPGFHLAALHLPSHCALSRPIYPQTLPIHRLPPQSSLHHASQSAKNRV